MKKFCLIVVVLLSIAAFARHDESVDALKAQAEAAGSKDSKKRVELYTKIAERQLDSLDNAYAKGSVPEARAALADVLNYSIQAARLAGESGKKMKATEIAIRKMSGRLESIRKNLDLDERPPVADAIQKLEAARTQLLDRMFRK